MVFLIFQFSEELSAQTWTIKHINNRDYVTGNSIFKFYGFSKKSRKGNKLTFHSPSLNLTVYVGSQTLIINGIKFITSFSTVKHGSDVLVSRTDLTKLIDPILRPKYIRRRAKFNTVIIDPGHGGKDPGARCSLGSESAFALDTAFQLKRMLEKKGLKVYLTRKNNSFIPLRGRVAIANRFRNAIFISLHYNSGARSASGIETFALSPVGSSSTFQGTKHSDYVKFNGNHRDSENIALATAVHASAIHRMKVTDRGVKRARWTVLTGLQLPGLLFEGGFLSNRAEASKIAQASYRKRLAESITLGIMNYRKALK